MTTFRITFRVQKRGADDKKKKNVMEDDRLCCVSFYKYVSPLLFKQYTSLVSLSVSLLSHVHSLYCNTRRVYFNT